MTATFHVETRAEYWRVQNFVGERPVLEDLIEELSIDDVFYDIGANIGLYGCIAAQHVTGGEVVAFEPHPETAGRLRRNLSRNTDRYSVYECALADRAGTMELGLPDGDARPGTFKLGSDELESSVRVDVTRGDDLRAQQSISQPTVVKIDVEGAELDVLDGLDETLRSDACRVVYVEVHSEILRANGFDPARVTERLERAGFDIVELHTRDAEEFYKAIRR
jgi:FkbM family methyltransferase